MNKINTLMDGSHGTDAYLINNVTTGVTNKGSKYLSVVVEDDSGTMDAKFWNVDETDRAIVVKGNVIEIDYDINRYNNTLQMRINAVRALDQRTVDLSQYVQKSPIGVEELKQAIRTAYENIHDPIYHKLVEAVFKRAGSRFFSHPAASRNHHNFYGGLATHVNGMLKLANAICDIYPQLNRDLLVSGVLCHDIGKLYELDSPIATQYTVEGNLCGHISIMHGMLMEIAAQLNLENNEQTLLLRHLILSHHGQYEYGSPVRPQLMEAEMLYYIDNIDAKMDMMTTLLSKTEAGCFSERMFALDNRRFYKPKSESDDEVE